MPLLQHSVVQAHRSTAKTITNVARVQARVAEMAARSRAAQQRKADQAAKEARAAEAADRVGRQRRAAESRAAPDAALLDAGARVLQLHTPATLALQQRAALGEQLAKRIESGARLTRQEQLLVRRIAAQVARDQAVSKARDVSPPGGAGGGTSLDTSSDVDITCWDEGNRGLTSSEAPIVPWADLVYLPDGGATVPPDAGPDGLNVELPVEAGSGPARPALVRGQLVFDPPAAAQRMDAELAAARERELRGDPDPRSLPERRPKAGRAVFVARMHAAAAVRRGDEQQAAALKDRSIELLLDLPPGEQRERGGRAWLRAEFVDQVMLQTRLHRLTRARVLQDRGREVAFERLVATGMDHDAAAVRVYGHRDRRPRDERDTSGDSHPGNVWHQQRARGQRHKTENLRDCGLRGAVVLRCPGCGKEHEIPLRCGDRLLCGSCRVRTALRYQDEFRRMRAGLYQAAEDAQLLWSRDRNRHAVARSRGCVLYRERLITLTAPHYADDTIRQRIDRIRDASARFLKLLRALQAEALRAACATIARTPEGKAVVHPLELCTYAAVDEWTPGADGRGHPHVHIWHFGPFLPHALLRDLWRACLIATDAKIERASVADPTATIGIVDVRAIQDGWVDSWVERGPATRQRARIEKEIFKYLAKDWTAQLERRVPPESFAEVVIAYDQKRMRRCSVGWRSWCVAKHRECGSCGSECAPVVRLAQWCVGSVERDVDRGDAWEAPERPTIEALAGPPTDGRLAAVYEELRDRYFADLDYCARRKLAQCRESLAKVRPPKPQEATPVDWSQLTLWAGERV